tara:strand:- start:123 stop:557 length:435 start_codon:yes stop_codon:yes gene_type:complete
MLAELAIANAAFSVIKTTLSNGRELVDAGKAVGDYFGAEKAIAKQVEAGTGDVLAAFQAKQQLQKQEDELKFMLNKQGLMGYHNFLEFKANYSREQKELQKEQARQRFLRQQKFTENLTIATKVFSIIAVVMIALFVAALLLWR